MNPCPLDWQAVTNLWATRKSPTYLLLFLGSGFQSLCPCLTFRNITTTTIILTAQPLLLCFSAITLISPRPPFTKDLQQPPALTSDQNCRRNRVQDGWKDVLGIRSLQVVQKICQTLSWMSMLVLCPLFFGLSSTLLRPSAWGAEDHLFKG